MISKFNSKLEYQIKIGKLSITHFAGFFNVNYLLVSWVVEWKVKNPQKHSGNAKKMVQNRARLAKMANFD